jgi:hypothetical protein
MCVCAAKKIRIEIMRWRMSAFLELKESPVGIVSTFGRHAFAAEPQNSGHRNCKAMERRQ